MIRSKKKEDVKTTENLHSENEILVGNIQIVEKEIFEAHQRNDILENEKHDY